MTVITMPLNVLYLFLKRTTDKLSWLIKEITCQAPSSWWKHTCGLGYKAAIESSCQFFKAISCADVAQKVAWFLESHNKELVSKLESLSSNWTKMGWTGEARSKNECVSEAGGTE